MSLNIYTGNRIESLVDALTEVVARPLSKVFVPEVIVMQSKGMQRWLAMELSSRFGVWANCSYPFPNALVADLFSRVLPDPLNADSFSPDILLWKLFSLLPDTVSMESFEPLRHYLDGDTSGIKLFQLSGKIADTFDQYTLYRPEILQRWENEGSSSVNEIWQAELWRILVSSTPGTHRGRLKEQFCALVSGMSSREEARIPERITVFGVSYLPPYHLEIISAVAAITEVNLFILSPTREYWADIASSRTIARLSPEQRALRIEGNPLLASLGRLGRDFSGMTTELAGFGATETGLYVDPGTDSLLHSIQSDILNLCGAEEAGGNCRIDPEDKSVQIHSCHSQIREAEVLHDQLLSMLADNPGLQPRDILVMTPDIEGYAPYITAVFEGAGEQGPRIPFSIADRRLASEGETASALIRLLALPGGRLTVIQLLDILSLSPVRRCFGIEESELPVIREWLELTRVRWGLDEKDRGRLGLPEYRANSWAAGLDRLLLGYAVSDNGQDLFNGILPFDNIEGSSSILLGKLIDFVESAGRLSCSLDSPRPLEEWAVQFRRIIGEFISGDDDTSKELESIGGILEELKELQQESGFGGDVTFEVIRSWLASRLDQEQKGLGFMTGCVTFCAMLPMRSIPFRVIAMIGMNDGAFPRQNMADGFDLVAANPRAGDRSLRDEDRYLFLETILSARNTLYISYIGQSMRDNSEIPPSVLVSELLDAVSRGFVCDTAAGSIEKRLVTQHRLQPFSRYYFTGNTGLFSYSAENCNALVEKSGGLPVKTEFMPIPLEEAPEELREIPLHSLLRFIVNPARFFLESRLGVRFTSGAGPLEEREPFGIDYLDAYQLKARIIEASLEGNDPRALLPVVRAQAILPPARHGDLIFEKQAADSADFATMVKNEIGPEDCLAPLYIDLNIEGFRIHGRLSGIWPQSMYRFRCAKQKAADLLKLWIEHLILNATATEGYPRCSMLMMSDKSTAFSSVENPVEILKSLLDLYWLGLTRPLPFFPESSWACATARTPYDPEKALKKWNDGYNSSGEGSDPYFRVCFGKADPFGAEFIRITRTVLEPLLQNKGRSN